MDRENVANYLYEHRGYVDKQTDWGFKFVEVDKKNDKTRDVWVMESYFLKLR